MYVEVLISRYFPLLQKTQADFVSLCINHLLGSSPKIILVGYSMGGLVAERVLRDGQVNSHVLMSITIGSPHFHLPSFLAPQYPLQIYSRNVREVPTVHILSGPGDFQVPVSSSWSAYTLQKFHNNLTFEVDMDDVPGVWATSSHKGLVSCNQLVRRIVPLILDSILMDSDMGVSPQDIYRFMKESLISRTSLGIQKILPKHLQKKDLHRENDCFIVSNAVHTKVLKPDDRQGYSCFSWEVDQAKDDTLFQIAIHGLKPGEDVQILGSGSNHDLFDLEYLFSPLPALSISEPVENRRFWQEVIQGVDWMQNSTWIAEIFSSALKKEGLQTLRLILDQKRPWIPGQSFSVVLTTTSKSTVHRSPETIQNHTIIKVDVAKMLTDYFWPILSVGTPHLSSRLLAEAIPLRIVLKAGSCSGFSHKQSWIPLFVSRNSAHHSPSDHIWRNSKRSTFSIPLWHPSSVSDSIFVLVDPLCQYSISIQQDILSAVSYSIRYQMYALPGLLLASSILRLVSITQRGSTWIIVSPNLKRYGVYCIFITVQAIILSRVLHNWKPGFVPWLFLLNPVGLFSILSMSFCLEIVIKMIFCALLNLTGYILPGKKKISSNRFESLSTILMFLSCIFHDFAPFYLALIYSLAHFRHYSSNVIEYSSVEWYMILLLGVGPMAVAMSGGTLYGYSHREKYGFSSFERLLVVFISFSTIKRLKSRASMMPVNRLLARSLLAYPTVLGSLFGFNFLPPVMVALLSLVEVYPLLNA